MDLLKTIAIILGVVLLFNFMIFVHELGHFLAAKWRGMYADRFQIWFGRPIFKKKINGVTWAMGWIPAGGFVSLPQMAPMEAIEGTADIPQNLKPATPLDKIIVAAAGPLASLLLAFGFAVLVWIVGKPGVELSDTTVGYVELGSKAEAAGILPGDKILKVDGQPVTKWLGNMEGVKELIVLGENKDVTFTIRRPGVEQELEISCDFQIPETSWWQRGGTRQVGLMYSMPCVVGDILPDSPAQHAGLQPGDTVLAINDTRLWNPVTMQDFLKTGNPVQLTVRRKDGTQHQLTLQAKVPDNWINKDTQQAMDGAHPIAGFLWDTDAITNQAPEYPSPFAQVGTSLKWMGDTLQKVVAPDSSVGVEHLSGPVGITKHLFDVFSVEGGWKLALWFAVILNVNLAVLNILPLPVVDGGHVVINAFELIFRKPFNVKILGVVQTVFAFVLIGFFIFVTTKDVGDLVGDNKKAPSLPAPQFKAHN